jgi:N-methylhydantoinase A
MTDRLRENGFEGRVLMLTSGGGMLDASAVADEPIHAINSGPSMAPIAGQFYGEAEGEKGRIIVADTGGTTYDVSLVRDGRIPVSREMWIGEPFRGHMTGFPSIDVNSIGAGGGSIAWVDSGGLLHVGPKSAGAVPGPVCYGRGGQKPTVTDASVALGYLDVDNFLGGRVKLDRAGAVEAIRTHVAEPLGMPVEEAAAAIMQVATENMVGAIADITIKQGIDTQDAVLIGGGGAAGLNSAWIARRLGCRQLIIPETGPALSAAGALMSDLSAEYTATRFTVSDNFDYDGINAMLDELRSKCDAFSAGPGETAISHSVELKVQARYRNQVWEIDLPVRAERFESEADVEALVADFHTLHEEIFAIWDPDSAVEFISWTAVVRCRLREKTAVRLHAGQSGSGAGTRRTYFPDHGAVDAPIYDFATAAREGAIDGPAIVESPFTTVVVPPGSSFERGQHGNLIVNP